MIEQASAIQNVRFALIEAEGFINKLADPLLANTCVLARHAIVAKKVADALTPAKVQLLMSGESVAAMVGMGEKSEAMKLLEQLRELDAQMVKVAPLAKELSDAKGRAADFIKASFDLI